MIRVETVGCKPHSELMTDGVKTCTKCREAVPLSGFYSDKRKRDGLRAVCKACYLAGRAAYKLANLDLVRDTNRRSAAKHYDSESGAAWRKANPEKMREYRKNWELRNPESVRAKWRRARERLSEQDRAELYRKQYQRNKADPSWRVKNSICSRLNRAIRTGKYGQRTEQALGYTVRDLMDHLERQFLPGMSWGNYGEWHIDHIVPLSAFSIQSYESPDFRRAWALPNLRPLWSAENISKGSKICHLC